MRTDRVAGISLALAGAAICLEASTFDVAFLTDPVGPKALPLLAGGMLVLTGLRMARYPGREASWSSRGALGKMALAVSALLAYAVLLPTLGFFVATTLVMTALSMLFEGGFRPSALAGAGVSTVLWYLFVWALSLPLPLGSLWTR